MELDDYRFGSNSKMTDMKGKVQIGYFKCVVMVEIDT